MLRLFHYGCPAWGCHPTTLHVYALLKPCHHHHHHHYFLGWVRFWR